MATKGRRNLPIDKTQEALAFENYVVERFISLVRRVSEEQGITLNSLGVKAGVGKVNIHQLLGRKRSFTLWTVAKLCYGLGIDIEFKVRTTGVLRSTLNPKTREP